MVQVEMRYTEDELREHFFGTLAEASQRDFILPEDINRNPWCELSERRLLEKIVECKPAGVSLQLNLSLLTTYMNNLYEDEPEGGCIEEYLTEKDKAVFAARREQMQAHHSDASQELPPRSYKPAYIIRPSPEDVLQHLDTLWSMSHVEENESLADELQVQSDFTLPTDFVAAKETKDELAPPALPSRVSSTASLRNTPAASASAKKQQQQSQSPATATPTTANARKRRGAPVNPTGDTPDSSRSSTPSQAPTKRHRGGD